MNIVGCMFSKMFTKEATTQGFLYFVIFVSVFLVINYLIDFIPSKRNK